MNSFSYIWLNIYSTLLRFIPLGTRTGLIKIGNPGRHSPVFLTGNYKLTVARVKKALKGVNGYLLVANSHGINVWCAAGGGHLNNHSVLSIIKTSGIGELVDHKNIILPQLAAVGVEAKEIKKRTGWTIIWGPVYAGDISAFLREEAKTEDMKEVKFRLPDRLEMAVAWAFSLSMIVGPFFFLIEKPLFFLLLPMIWIFALLLYGFLPLYSRCLNVRGELAGFAAQYIFPLILWVLFMSGHSFFYLLNGGIQVPILLRWGLTSLAVVLVLGFEIRGTTPLFSSSFQEKTTIHLDPELCRGAGFCSEVCPRNRFMMEKKNRKIEMKHAADCVQCGACVVQCPFDALFFLNQKGEKIPPSTIRAYKLNLLGKRGDR